MSAKKVNAIAQLAKEFLYSALSGNYVIVQFRRTRHHVTALAHGKIAQKRQRVAAHVEHQHTTQTDFVVNESDQRAGNQPASLHTGQQKSIGVNELVPWRHFLDKRSDRR